MVLDIFTQKLGDLNRPHMTVRADDEGLGQTAVALIDCIQTVVDVMSDPKNGAGYRVSFAPGSSAYTSHKERVIVISAAPLLDAKMGTPLADIAAVITGFAVHEVGHTLHNITGDVGKHWPGKQVPRTLGNIIEDVVLEANVVRRYAGFREVFKPTFDWVAAKTCPTFPIPWGTTTGSRVNFIGQVVRYRDYVTFATDAASQRELAWFDDWAKRITYSTTSKQAIDLVTEALVRIHDHTNDEPPEQGESEPEPGEGEPGEGEGKGKGEGKGDEPNTDPTIAEDEPEDDGSDGDGDGDGEGEGESGEGESESESGEGESGEGQGESSDGGQGDPGEGNDDGDPTEGTTQTADTTTEGRVDLDKGTNDTDGKGGSGQGISEVGDPDKDLDVKDLPKTFDEVMHGDGNYEDHIVDAAITTERATTRLDAKEHGHLRVIWRD